mmetsp:Transcript_20279/g.57097  ORF Transcript_20279/g.57097 Transcript_20279/m.57097 type:complete len:167 (+) Transcript_20279:98-598(+)
MSLTRDLHDLVTELRRGGRQSRISNVLSLETVLSLFIGFTLTSFTVPFKEEGEDYEKTTLLMTYFLFQSAALFTFISCLLFLLIFDYSDVLMSTRFLRELKCAIILGISFLLCGLGFYIRLRVHSDFVEFTCSWVFWLAAGVMCVVAAWIYLVPPERLLPLPREKL